MKSTTSLEIFSKLIALVAVLALVSLVACGPQSPEAALAIKRAAYDVQINSFQVIDPVSVEPLDVDLEAIGMEDAAIGEEVGEETEEPAADAAAEGAEAEEALEDVIDPTDIESVPAGPTEVRFDVIVRYDGAGDPLPGITVEVIQYDAAGEEKDRQRHYLDTSSLVPDDRRQESFVLEGFEVEETDSFGVTIRQVIPEDERDAYREYGELESGT